MVLQQAELPFDGLAAVNGGDAHVAIPAQGMDGLGDLDGQLPRGNED